LIDIDELVLLIVLSDAQGIYPKIPESQILS
jgi:hypothetical protein